MITPRIQALIFSLLIYRMFQPKFQIINSILILKQQPWFLDSFAFEIATPYKNMTVVCDSSRSSISCANEFDIMLVWHFFDSTTVCIILLTHLQRQLNKSASKTYLKFCQNCCIAMFHFVLTSIFSTHHKLRIAIFITNLYEFLRCDYFLL